MKMRGNLKAFFFAISRIDASDSRGRLSFYSVTGLRNTRLHKYFLSYFCPDVAKSLSTIVRKNTF